MQGLLKAHQTVCTSESAETSGHFVLTNVHTSFAMDGIDVYVIEAPDAMPTKLV